MRISIDWGGCYLEHKIFFDEMAKSMKASGHEVGIVSGERQAREQEIRNSLGFEPDFMALWGDYETIANGYLWKCQKLDVLDVVTHFDDDATEMKRYTDRWIIKTLNSAERVKF